MGWKLMNGSNDNLNVYWAFQPVIEKMAPHITGRQVYKTEYLISLKVKVKLFLCLTKHHSMKAYSASGGIAPRILNLGTRWRWVVSFTPQPLYPQGKSPWYPLDKRLGGPQSRSGRGGEGKNSRPPSGIEPYNPNRPARNPALYRLRYDGFLISFIAWKGKSENNLGKKKRSYDLRGTMESNLRTQSGFLAPRFSTETSQTRY
jgi:hypothetical protein